MAVVFFMLFGGPFVGKVFDDYGPRRLLAGGACLHVFGLMMTSISTKYYQFLLSQAICSAIGASMVFYPAFNCVSSARKLGITSLIGPLGIHVVLRQARRRPRTGCSWIVSRWRHFSHYGREVDSRSRFRLGNANLRLFDIGTLDFRKFDGAFSPRAIEAPNGRNGLHPSSEGADILSSGCRNFLFFL